MSGALSKRQQARNEKVLQDLVHNTPGNDVCADCQARNPSWASWNLGVFLCMRCAAIHRKLGTHISKIKSLSMDSWSNEQVENMRKVGNVASNRIYNPENKSPPVPIDVDEADSAMERFIRRKYSNTEGTMSDNARSRRLDEGTPPPLPPKNSSKFGFRSASSIFPLSSKAKKEAKFAAAHNERGSASFGATVDDSDPSGGSEDTDAKLARLQDMGFPNSQRNAKILKSVNGDMVRAVEALIRLGEGSGQPSPRPPAKDHGLRTSRSMTPITTNSMGLGAGLQVPKKPEQDRPTTPAGTSSNNPFDLPSPAQPQTAHSTGTLPDRNPFHNNLQANPWGQPAATQNDTLLQQAFQNLGLSSSQQQPLQAHHTGGYPLQSQHQQQLFQQQQPQAFALSAPATPQGVLPGHGIQQSMTFPQMQPVQSQPTGYNPFFSQPATPVHQHPQQLQQQATQQPAAPYMNGTGGPAAYNPFARSPTRLASPPLSQIPEQSTSMFPRPPGATSIQTQPTGTNPFFNAPMQSPPPQPNQTGGSYQNLGVQQQHQQQQMYFQAQQQPQQSPYATPFPAPRVDKASIMALYGQAQFGSQPASPAGQPLGQTMNAAPQAAAASFPMGPGTPQAQGVLQQNIAAPIGGVGSNMTNNPYMKAAAPQQMTPSPAGNPFVTTHQVSRESVILGKDLAWTNGRHSPDAFASLSARHA